MTSVPPVTLDWEIYDDPDSFPINAFIDRAIVGLNGSLYLQNPTGDQDDETFECSASNRESGSSVHGYVQITVEGRCDLVGVV